MSPFRKLTQLLKHEKGVHVQVWKFYKLVLFIYFGCAGSSLLCMGYSLVAVQSSHYSGFSCWKAQAQ